MNTRIVGYWITTLLLGTAYSVAGVAYMLGNDLVAQRFSDLGYPAYLIPLLGAFKLAGGVTILLPKLPRLKEWAYAGITFNLLGAAISHAASGHGPVEVIVPLLGLAVATSSWAFRPAERTVGVVTGGFAPMRRARSAAGGSAA